MFFDLFELDCMSQTERVVSMCAEAQAKDQDCSRTASEQKARVSFNQGQIKISPIDVNDA